MTRAGGARPLGSALHMPPRCSWPGNFEISISRDTLKPGRSYESAAQPQAIPALMLSRSFRSCSRLRRLPLPRQTTKPKRPQSPLPGLTGFSGHAGRDKDEVAALQALAGLSLNFLEENPKFCNLQCSSGRLVDGLVILVESVACHLLHEDTLSNRRQMSGASLAVKA